MGAFEPINRIFEPIMAPLRYMPISAFIPLLILWFGIYESQKIAFLFLGVFVYLLPVVVTAIRAVPEELVQTALTLGASRWQVVRTVLLPAALPEIFDSFRVMNAISWTYVILAEAVNPEHGLGYMVELARTHQKASWSFAGLLVIGGIGLLTDCAHPRLLGGAVPLEGEGGMTETVPSSQIKDLGVTYVGRDGRKTEAVRDVSLDIADKPGIGEIVVFLGPSGLRQVDDPQGRRRPAPADQGRGPRGGREGRVGRPRPRAWSSRPTRRSAG